MIPKTLPIIIELEKVFMINLAAAAGVSSILKTKIIPTDCNDAIIAKDKTTKKMLSKSFTCNPATVAPIGSNETNKNCL